MNCEICGKNTELCGTMIENTKLNVCKDCSSFGNVIEKKEEVAEEKINFVRRDAIQESNEIIVDEYAGLVKTAREKKNMTQEELGKAIAEKESIIHKIESGHMAPQMKTAKKLEQFLKIKLITKYEGNEIGIKLDFKDDTMTIGDIMKIREKENA